VQGKDGTFLVLAVNRARGVADLMPARKGQEVEKDVPLSSILPLAPKPQDAPSDH
jgi:hypothetical protein